MLSTISIERKPKYQLVKIKLPFFCNPISRTTKLTLLNAELNPICHLLVLLEDLTFMGPCIVSTFQYISNKMQRYTVYLYLETTLHVSGGSPDDGWKYHPKHVKQFPDINKLWNVASCWIYEYIGILLEVYYILHISRIRVKNSCSKRLIHMYDNKRLIHRYDNKRHHLAGESNRRLSSFDTSVYTYDA